VSESSPRTAIALVVAAAVLGLVFYFRERSREPEATTPAASASVQPAAIPPPPYELPQPIESVAAPSEPAADAEPPQVPVIEGSGGVAPTLADINARVRSAILTEVRRCNPGKPITEAIANRRVVFYFTQNVAAGNVTLLNIQKIDSDIGDDRLESCILNRVADVRLSAPGASDTSPRLQETIDLRELTPSP
jgi:hypothetical protein